MVPVPRRRRPRACGISTLPPELLNAVLDYLTWPFDFRAVSLVSNAFSRSAAPYLYKAVVVTHTSLEPTLCMLHMLKASPDKAALVHTIVVDEIVSALFSPSPHPSLLSEALRRLRRRNRSAHPDTFRLSLPLLPVPNEALREIAMTLYSVIPDMRNLRELFLRIAHPFLIASFAWLPPWRRANPLRRLKNLIVRGSSRTPRTQAAIIDTEIDYYSFYWADSGSKPFEWNLWDAVARQQQYVTVPFERLSITGLTCSCSWSVGPLRSLHVLHIALRVTSSSFESWQGLLSHLRHVDTLCITGHGRGRLGTYAGGIQWFLPHCGFERLRTLQLWNVALYPGEPETLQAFVCKHAPHLEILALSTAFSPVGLVVPLPLLPHDQRTGAPCDFPRLHTLRLDNVEQGACFGCVYRAAGVPIAHPPGAQHALATDLALDALRRVVAGSAGITDLALAGLHDAETLAAVARACEARPMRRMLVGDALDRSFRQHVSARGVAGRAQAERWLYHEVLFKGLELARPEYADHLLAVGLPRNRLQHHHGY